MEIAFDIKIPILIGNSFSVLKRNSYARGYHAYMDIWKPLIGDDSLRCTQVDDNIHDNILTILDLLQLVMFHSYILQRLKVSFFTKSYNKGVGH